MRVHINLEQTINAEAKISSRGITAYADVPFVINRGIITNVMRTQLANWLLELVNLLHVYNGNKKLRESKSERDKTVIDQTKDQTKIYYLLWERDAELHFVKICAKDRSAFLEECCERFKEQIKGTKICNLSLE